MLNVRVKSQDKWKRKPLELQDDGTQPLGGPAGTRASVGPTEGRGG